MVKCTNGTLTQILWKLASLCTSSWEMYLGAAVFVYNILLHSTTGASPNQLMYGCHPVILIVLYSATGDPGQLSYIQYLGQLANTLIKLQASAFSNTAIKTQARFERDSSNRALLPSFELGEGVAFCNTQEADRSHKLDNLWVGPFEIIEKTSPDAYTIKDKDSGCIFNRVHAKFLCSF